MNLVFTNVEGVKPSQVEEYSEVLSSPPDPAEIEVETDETTSAPDCEFWVREFFEEHADGFGFEIESDLDEEYPYSQRGDYKVRYEEEKRILEVEKDLADFFSHGHEFSETTGWNDIADIGVVFAITDRGNRAGELPIPVIIEKTADEDCESFGSWFVKVNQRDYIFNTVPQEFIQGIAVYVSNVLLRKDLPSPSDLQEEIADATESEAELQRTTIRMQKNRGAARQVVTMAALQYLPDSSDTSAVIDVVQNADSVDEIVNSVCNRLLEEEQAKSEGRPEFDCDCSDSESTITIGVAERPVHPNRIEDELTEAQWSDQLACMESRGMTEGYKDLVAVPYCAECQSGFYFVRREYK